MGKMRRQRIKEKSYAFVKMWNCEWLSLHKTDASVKQLMTRSFLPMRPFREEAISEKKTKFSSLFDFLQCDVHVLDDLRK